MLQNDMVEYLESYIRLDTKGKNLYKTSQGKTYIYSILIDIIYNDIKENSPLFENVSNTDFYNFCGNCCTLYLNNLTIADIINANCISTDITHNRKLIESYFSSFNLHSILKFLIKADFYAFIEYPTQCLANQKSRIEEKEKNE